MRDIHPEILLESYNEDKVLKLIWDSIKDTQDSWSVKLDNTLAKTADYYINAPKSSRPQRANIFNWVLYPLEDIIKNSIYPYSYYSLTRLEEYTDLCILFARLISGSDDQAVYEKRLDSVHVHNMVLFSYLTWKMSGKKTYTVSKGLFEALSATTLKNYPSNLLKLPHSCIYIEFPKGSFLFTTFSDEITKSDTGYINLPVEGVYIVEDDSFQDIRVWRVVVVCTYTDEPSDKVHINHYFIPLFKDKSVDYCLENSIRIMRGERHIDVIQNGEKGVIGNTPSTRWSKNIIDCAESVFRLVMNVIIYVTHGDADSTLISVSPEYTRYREQMLLAKGSRREKLLGKLKKLNNNLRILLGKSYTIKRWDDQVEISNGESTGRHITVRTLVSGHWRNQVCGVGGLERKIIWIEPHWRGPEAAPLTEKRAAVR